MTALGNRRQVSGESGGSATWYAQVDIYERCSHGRGVVLASSDDEDEHKLDTHEYHHLAGHPLAYRQRQPTAKSGSRKLGQSRDYSR